MNGINTVIYEAISVKDPKPGKYGDFWSYGIKIQGEWHNGILNSQEQVDGMKLKKGQEIELFFYHDEQYGNKVRFITDKDRKEAPKTVQNQPKLDELENRSYQAPEVAIAEALKRIEALEAKVLDLSTEVFGMGNQKTEESKFNEPQGEQAGDDLDDLPF